MNQDYVRGGVAVLAGCALIFLGDALLGVQIEIFRGITTFTMLWTVNVFLVPFIAGLVVALIYKKRGGKYLAFLPPVMVRFLNCLYLYFTNPQWHEDLFLHLHLHYWGLVVILCFMSSYLGANWGCVLAGAYKRHDVCMENAKNQGLGKVTP